MQTAKRNVMDSLKRRKTEKRKRNTGERRIYEKKQTKEERERERVESTSQPGKGHCANSSNELYEYIDRNCISINCTNINMLPE